MPFAIQVQDATVKKSDEIMLTDRSGAHVELTLLIGREPPIRHAFAFSAGVVTLPLPETLKAGKHRCSLVAMAFRHKHVQNRHFDFSCDVGGTKVAAAEGDIPKDRTNDVGIGDFVLTVK